MERGIMEYSLLQDHSVEAKGAVRTAAGFNNIVS